MAMDLFWAFLVGGALCAVGQVLIDYTKLTPARILTAYVVAGVASGTCWQRACGNPWTKRDCWASSWAV